MAMTDTSRPTRTTVSGIDALRWPEIATVPHSPVRAAIAKRLFRHAAAKLPMRVVEPGDQSYGGGTHDDPVFRLVRPDAFFHRLGETGTIGFGEAYMAGDWTSDDLAGVLSAFASNMKDMIPPVLHKLRNAVLSVQPHNGDNTIENARDNIHQHYDLSNELFTLFLDETMTYSSGVFAGEPYNSTEPLIDAQHRKIDRLARQRRRHRGHPAARDRHRLGRALVAGRRPWRPGRHAHDLHRAGRAGPAAHRRRRVQPTASRCGCRTTAR